MSFNTLDFERSYSLFGENVAFTIQRPEQWQEAKSAFMSGPIQMSITADLPLRGMDMSPELNTPYLDSGDTPGSAATHYTFPQDAHSPFYSPVAEVDQMENKEAFVSYFMSPQTPPTPAVTANPPATFNGDPTQLLIDKTRHAKENEHSVYNLLFGPEPSLQVSHDEVSPTSYSHQHPDWPIFSQFYNIDSQTINANYHDVEMGEPGNKEQDSTLEDPSDHDDISEHGYEGENGQGGNDDESENDHDEEEEDDDDDSDNYVEGRVSRQRRTSRQRKPVRGNRVKKVRHDDQTKRHACHICKRRFTRRYNLNTHIKTHDKERVKAFQCEHCPSAFDRKHDRDRHIASVHFGERAHGCANCGVKFSRSDALARHFCRGQPSA